MTSAGHSSQHISVPPSASSIPALADSPFCARSWSGCRRRASLSGRYGAAALRLQVAAHHCALRRAERAVSGSRAGRGVPGHRLQHGQRAGARRDSGRRAGSGAGRDRARRSRRARRIAHRRRAGDRHRGHGAQPRLRGRLPAQGLRALEKACPLLVPLVEEGWTDHPVTAEVIDIYLNELRAEAAAQGMNPDTLVLGCTHYPLLRPLIERAVRPGAKVIDSAESAAQAAVELFNGAHAAADRADLPRRPRCAVLPPIPWRNSSGWARDSLGGPLGRWN